MAVQVAMKEQRHKEMVEELARELAKMYQENASPLDWARRAFEFFVEEKGFLPPAEVDRRREDRA